MHARPSSAEHWLELDELESTDETPADEFELQNEMQELRLAGQLLEATNEMELEAFIGGMLRQASPRPPSAALLASLRRTLRRAARTALPGGHAAAAGAYSNGTDAGRRLAAAAEDMFGLELEGLSPEDQEFELARRFVRLTRSAGRHAARMPARLPAHAAARRALRFAARRHAPGLVRGGTRLIVHVPVEEPPHDDSGHCTCGGTCAHCRAHASGRWVRDGRTIVLQDV